MTENGKIQAERLAEKQDTGVGEQKPKVYIDGQEGTTGLQIYERLGSRSDIELLHIDPALRKDAAERGRLINTADLVFLCLPDDAAREAVTLLQPENTHTRFIDASTAHRTAEGWVYGLPELSAAQRTAIQRARFVANPGCHATGFITAVYPLVKAGLVRADAVLTSFSLTGYSGGGKKMIAEYEAKEKPPLYGAPRLYGLGQKHKHLPEMQKICGLERPPVFCPVVDDYYCGMAVTTFLNSEVLSGMSVPSPEALRLALQEAYEGAAMVETVSEASAGMLSAELMAGSDRLKLLVEGSGDRMTVTALFDNLGKGASGAAVQNMNLMLGFAETKGLRL